jgi:hypothetical protein
MRSAHASTHSAYTTTRDSDAPARRASPRTSTTLSCRHAGPYSLW